MILTGSCETAALFRSWRPDLPLLAETSGKNAMIVMPSADLDLAAGDLIKSAFGHAGQKCSAASLAILVGPVGHSRRFARQLVDAAASLRVGPPTDPLAEVGPVDREAAGQARLGAVDARDDERWLVEPRPSAISACRSDAGRLWSPGIRTGVRPGSRFHREEFFGPVLGIMHANSLAQAIELQNAVAYGLTAGLYTQHPGDLEVWLDRVEAGNLYVNRGITGAIVQRQPFGGWKRSSVGAGTKAGGPNYLIGLGSWRPTAAGSASATLHLRGLDSRITVGDRGGPAVARLRRLRVASARGALGRHRLGSRVRPGEGCVGARRRAQPVPLSPDVGGRHPRHRRCDLAVGAARRHRRDPRRIGAHPQRSRRAPLRSQAGCSATTASPCTSRPMRSGSTGSPGRRHPVTGNSSRRRLRRASAPRPPRARLVGSPESVARLHRALAEAIAGDPDLAVYDNEVTTAGRLELLPFLHEQSVTITAHRFGNPDRWSEAVI